MKGIDDSAQLILVAGFAIGVAIIVSTVMLNNIIYAGNTASDSSVNAERFESSGIAKLTDDAVQTAYNISMANGTFNETYFNQYMESYGDAIADIGSLSGISISVERHQSSGNPIQGYFTDNGSINGNPDWVVVENVNSIDTFIVDIPDASTLVPQPNSGFEIQAINQAATTIWSIVFFNTGQYEIKYTYKNGTFKTYQASGTDGRLIDIINDQVVVDDPPLHNGFEFDTSTAGETYKIEFLNGHNAAGNITISGTLANGQSFSMGSDENYFEVTTSSGTETNSVNIPIPQP